MTEYLSPEAADFTGAIVIIWDIVPFIKKKYKKPKKEIV